MATGQAASGIGQVVGTAKALADPSRLRILAALDGGELCLCHLIELLELAPSTVSKHADLLRQAGLVEQDRRGKWRYYRLAGRGTDPSVRRALAWVREALAGDPIAAADARRLATLRARNLVDVAQCYRG